MGEFHIEKRFLNVPKMSHFTNLPLNYAQLGDPLESRQKEEELRGPAVMELTYCINSFREAAQSKDAKFDHIDAADKEKVCALPHEIQLTLFLWIKMFSLLFVQAHNTWTYKLVISCLLVICSIVLIICKCSRKQNLYKDRFAGCQ